VINENIKHNGQQLFAYTEQKKNLIINAGVFELITTFAAKRYAVIVQTLTELFKKAAIISGRIQ
jgi:hypothetical protein